MVGQLAGQLVRMHHAWDPLRWMMPAGVEEGYARFFASQLDDPDTIILVAEDALGEVAGYAYARIPFRGCFSCNFSDRRPSRPKSGRVVLF